MDSSGQNSTSISTPSTRGKTDPTWEHVTEGELMIGRRLLHVYIVERLSKVDGLTE